MEEGPQLVDKIVHEVKSQGVFDEFRRDVNQDVDTKPAYQNLRQRVEVSVKKFLSEQRWTPEMNKNQLRERLRRHITETRANFLDVGVERIVDQVVNPKISSVFQPRIEEITYKYLGLTPPPPLPQHPYDPSSLMHSVFPPLPMNGGGGGVPVANSSTALKVETMPVASLLPTDLEQVSPDSDKATVKSECKEEETAEDDMDLDPDEKQDDDDESPPFEPLMPPRSEVELRDSDMDTSDSPEPPPHIEDTILEQPQQEQDTETQDTTVSVNTTTEVDSEKEGPSRGRFSDAAKLVAESFADPGQDVSQLSQVSSDSRISTASPNFNEDNNTEQTQKSQSSGSGTGVGGGGGGGAPQDAAVNISEEAQMPKFSENSSSEATGGVNGHEKNGPQLHFDIKKDEIKFEGTERKTNLPPDVSNDGGSANQATELKTQKNEEIPQPNPAFHFSATDLNSVSEEDPPAPATTHPATLTSTTLDSSFGSSLEDTNSLQLGGNSDMEKNKSVGDDGGGGESNTRPAPEQLQQSLTPSASGGSADAAGAATTKGTSDTAIVKHTASTSSSSSQHKKHSKEKRRSHEKDRHHRSSKGGGGESDKSRNGGADKEKDRHHSSSSSRSKHSSSSSAAKHLSSSSHSKTSDVVASTAISSTSNKTEKPVSTLAAAIQSSQSETKRERKRDSGGGGGSSSSEKHRSSSSGSKEHAKQQQQQRKTTTSSAVPNDDHNESKEKLHWRKSTDSSDEDKSTRGGSNAAAGKGDSNNKNKSGSSSNSKSKSKNATSEVNVKSTQNDAVADEAIKESTSTSNAQLLRSSKVVILNEILQNPATDFIALEATLTTAQANHVQIVRNNTAMLSASTTVTATTEDITASPAQLDLHFFEENSNQFVTRLRLLDNAIDRCRKVINTLRFDIMPAIPPEDDEEEELSGTEVYGGFGTRATLLVDCIRYSAAGCSSSEQTDCEGAPLAKRSKRIENYPKSSPTPSDTSVNSKENETFEKNSVDVTTKKTVAAACVRRRSININAVQKLSQQQRYTSEDLYKPRPILSQRSRRRGVNTII